METLIEPHFIRDYDVRETVLSPIVRRLSFTTQEGVGALWLASLYPGVEVWYIDFHLPALKIEAPLPYHYLKLNYCFSGRCEVRLPNDRYVYLNSGRLSLDTNPQMDSMRMPGGEYIGLELVIDLTKITADSPAAWAECGVRTADIAARLRERQGSYLTQAAPLWEQPARELAGHLRAADLALSDYRYRVLQLLWLLKQRPAAPDGALVFLTPGQRAAALRAQALVTQDLRRHYLITDLAAAAGVSPASLKKHFAQVNGKPISVYLRDCRVERAKALLARGTLRIADVAGEVGYENQGKFGVMFRQQTGQTPLEYRRLHRSDRFAEANQFESEERT